MVNSSDFIVRSGGVQEVIALVGSDSEESLETKLTNRNSQIGSPPKKSTSPGALRISTDSKSLANDCPKVSPDSSPDPPPRTNGAKDAAFSDAARLHQGGEALAATSSGEPGKGIRRSGRKRKSTLVHIDGHAVLAKNNYRVNGIGYEYGAYQVDEPKKTSRARSKNEETAPKGSKTRVVGQSEKKRIVHNEKVKAQMEQKLPRRQAFLAKNVETFAPFLDPKVLAKIRSFPLVSDDVANGTEIFLQPDCLKGDMRDYQLQGLNWMVKMHHSNLGMILGDEMGLGKTLQSISLLCYLKENRLIDGPSLVVCPLSVLDSWCKELKRWAPSLKFLRLHSSDLAERESQRKIFVEKATDFDVVITTYDMVKNPALTSLWTRQHFNYLILDEGHKIKNAGSQVSEASRKVHSENVLILTGTPLQNNLVELWAMLNFLYRDVFTVREPFTTSFDLNNQSVDKKMLDAAHRVLGLVMLRRLKIQVEEKLPKKIETKVICPLSDTQVFWYKALLMRDMKSLANISGHVESGTETVTGRKMLNNLIMQLRKCCLHPFLFPGAESDIEATSCSDLVAASGKFSVLDMLLCSLFQKGHRTVLFSQFTSVLDIIDDYCALRGWKYCRFDGSTPRAKRNFIVNRFNAPDSDCFIFLMSTRSGGMGLNLQTADTCIIFDSDWNPQQDIQAMARVHRIGQTKTVHVYRLVSGGTVEERILERSEKKLYLDQLVNRDSAPAPEKTPGGLSAAAMLSTLRFGCDAVFGKSSQNVLPTEEEIGLITDRTRSKKFTAGNLKGGTTKNASDFNAESKFTATQAFGGVDFRALREKQKAENETSIPKKLAGISRLWIEEKSKRDRKSRIMMVDGMGSGCGRHVPILTSNNYELQNGESSVFEREFIDGRDRSKEKGKTKKERTFGEQDMCQLCGGNGELLICPRCPVCVHADCVGISCPKQFRGCPHHRCSLCFKDSRAAGGLLYPCQICPLSFCEDCLPSKEKGLRILGVCERFEKLGFDNSAHAYIHCSSQCEKHAIDSFGWMPPKNCRQQCPEPLDVSFAFTSQVNEKGTSIMS